MTTQTNIEVAKRFLFNHNRANYRATFDETLAPDVAVHEYLPGLPNPMNRAIYEQFIAGFRAALPDIHNELVDIVASDDLVAMRWTGSGTHTGEPLMQIPAKGNRVTANGIYMLRLRDGKIAEVWNNWDNLNVAQQLQA